MFLRRRRPHFSCIAEGGEDLGGIAQSHEVRLLQWRREIAVGMGNEGAAGISAIYLDGARMQVDAQIMRFDVATHAGAQEGAAPETTAKILRASLTRPLARAVFGYRSGRSAGDHSTASHFYGLAYPPGTFGQVASVPSSLPLQNQSTAHRSPSPNFTAMLGTSPAHHPHAAPGQPFRAPGSTDFCPSSSCPWFHRSKWLLG
jgi:hypothetical protein